MQCSHVNCVCLLLWNVLLCGQNAPFSWMCFASWPSFRIEDALVFYQLIGEWLPVFLYNTGCHLCSKSIFPISLFCLLSCFSCSSSSHLRFVVVCWNWLRDHRVFSCCSVPLACTVPCCLLIANGASRATGFQKCLKWSRVFVFADNSCHEIL